MSGTEFGNLKTTAWKSGGGFISQTTTSIDIATTLKSESETMTPTVEIITLDYAPILNIAPNKPEINNYDE